MNQPAEHHDGLIFTDAAARKVGELIREEGNPKLKLRVFVSGGGCSGFQYGFSFDNTTQVDDHLFERDDGLRQLRRPIGIRSRKTTRSRRSSWHSGCG